MTFFLAFFACFYDIEQTMKPIWVIFWDVLGLFIKIKEYFKGACHYIFVSAAEVLEIVQLVCNMELLVISSMSEVGRERKVCFVAFLKL